MEAGLTNWVDILLLVLYFVLTLAVGVWSTCRKGRETVKGYFLAGRNMWWLPIGFSLFGSNIGTEHFIGLAGGGASSGIASVAFEWFAIIHLLLLGWIFVPVYLLFGVYTVPEFLERRYGGIRIRMYFSCMSMFMYMASKISVDVFAGAVFIQQSLGWNIYVSVIGLLVITAIYTVAGGLAAVIYTDTLQTAVMVIGSLILSIIGFIKVGGVTGVYEKYPYAVPSSVNLSDVNNTTCGLPREDYWHIFRDPVTGDYPWPGLLVRLVFGSMWYWCADQVIVQRALAAKDISHARGGVITAGYLKLLPMVVMVFPGMISRILYPDEVACVDPIKCKEACDNEAGCSNIAYPKLVLGLAPTGLRGIMIAVMMAALMSSLTSVLNSAATVFSMDIWKKFRPKATERELVITGRVFVVFLTVTGVAWIPLVKSAEGAQLFYYLQAITGYIAPPIVSCFLMTMFVPWTTEPGVFWGMLIGHIGGITRLILDFVYKPPKCGEEDTRPAIVGKVNATYVAAFLLIMVAAIVFVVSLITRKKGQQSIMNYWTVHNSVVKGHDLPTESQLDAGHEMTATKTVVEPEQDYDDEVVETPDMESVEKEKMKPPERYVKHMTIEERLKRLRLTRGWSIFLNVNAVIIFLVLFILLMIFR